MVTELWFLGTSYGYDRFLKKGACRGSRRRGAGVAGLGGGDVMNSLRRYSSPQENSMERADAEATSSQAEEMAMEECGVSEAAPWLLSLGQAGDQVRGRTKLCRANVGSRGDGKTVEMMMGID